MAVTKRGTLRVLLGAAPGVGKTYAMLSEGRRLVEEGKDVVIALLETHGRKATQNAAKGLETVPRRCMKYRGMWFNEMDLFAVIARRPQVALVDELAHTNIPGCTHEKRWQDVVDLLDAGIDVITTINVQHIESLNDVVRSITNSEQRETVPDKVLRSADSIELIDLPPKNLRERLSAGLVYSADRVDAALSNYFRVGNLTALRELALLWLAGNVDEALQEYRNEHHINAKWETRERVVVALSGGPEGEQLLRRGARVARASGGGDLIAVHVTAEDGLHGFSPGLLVQQRELVEKLGGTYHQIVGEDISDALISFARANNATQIIVGARRPPLARWLGRPSSANGIIANSGDIDVHVVTHTFAAKGMRLPRMKRTMTMRRRIAGCIFSLLSVPLLGWLLMQYSGVDALSRDSLFFQLLVVIAALIGGVSSATLCALLSGLVLDYVYFQPVGSLHMLRAQDVMTIVLYILIGIIVSFVVDRADEKARQAQRATAESEVLASVSDAVLRSSNPLQAILTAPARRSASPACASPMTASMSRSAAYAPPGRSRTSSTLTRSSRRRPTAPIRTANPMTGRPPPHVMPHPPERRGKQSRFALNCTAVKSTRPTSGCCRPSSPRCRPCWNTTCCSARPTKSSRWPPRRSCARPCSTRSAMTCAVRWPPPRLRCPA